MSDELIAIISLFAWSVGSGLFAIWQVRKIKTEIREEATGMIAQAGDMFIEGIGEVLTEPTVKKAFSIIGKQGGEQRAENALVGQMAADALDSPQFAAIKMGASSLGFDLDGYIEQHGAVKTLTAASQLGKILGIDIMNLDLGALLGGATQGGPSGGDNPYLRR